MPELPAIVSSMSEPTRATYTATFEAKKYGIERGRPTFSGMSRGLALRERSTSFSSGSKMSSRVRGRGR
jgi:hypothetical protein